MTEHEEKLEKLIARGSDILNEGALVDGVDSSLVACEVWLEAWDMIKQLYVDESSIGEINIIVLGADPDKRLAQGHITNGPVDPGNILKEIVDVAINVSLPVTRPPPSSSSVRRWLSNSLTSSFVIAIASPYAWLT